jgi:hypothetical protein
MQSKIVGENFPIGVNVVDLVIIKMELNGEYKISKQEKASVIADLALHMKFKNVRFKQVVVIGNMTTILNGVIVRLPLPFVLVGSLREPNGDSPILAVVALRICVHPLLLLSPSFARFLVVAGEITALNPYVDTINKEVDV